MYFEIGFLNEAEFMLTSRGSWKLVFDGFQYTRKRQPSEDTTFWVCSRSRWKNCRGKAVTQLFDQKYMVKSYAPHNHQKEEFDSQQSD